MSRFRPARGARRVERVGTRPPDATNPYVVGIKSRFVSLIGGTLPGPDPFTESLVEWPESKGTGVPARQVQAPERKLPGLAVVR